MLRRDVIKTKKRFTKTDFSCKRENVPLQNDNLSERLILFKHQIWSQSGKQGGDISETKCNASDSDLELRLGLSRDLR